MLAGLSGACIGTFLRRKKTNSSTSSYFLAGTNRWGCLTMQKLDDSDGLVHNIEDQRPPR